MADGLVVKFGVDIDNDARKTWKLNFPNATFYHMSIDEFIQKHANSKFKVDHVHFSPPCQPFSQANTTPNPEKNDDNKEAFRSMFPILDILKPRFVTIEESPNLQSKQHQEFFTLLL